MDTIEKTLSHLSPDKIIAAFVIYAIIHGSIWLSRNAHKLPKLFIKTERELACWLHGHAHIRGHGHNAKSPAECTDGKCALL